MMLSLFFTAVGLLQAVAANSCKSSVVWDGRVPVKATGASFDAGSEPYNNLYDLGKNLTWADVLRFPNVPPSLFDEKRSTKAVEVTLDDRSIFAPSDTNVQTGFRRAELLAVPANATASTTGIKTLHWSIMSDFTRPLNYSHEYQLVFLESADYSADQFTLGTGTIFGSKHTTPQQAKTLFVRGIDTASPQVTFFQTPFIDGIWHNFALKLNFNANTVEVFYSRGQASLKSQGPPKPNDLSGLGEYHFGALKKPTGDGLTDITKQGFQESGIHEGIIYGGIFEEDSAGGCVSLSTSK